MGLPSRCMHSGDCWRVCRVVHLDLKSCNVLIGGDGTAKISDVGLALLIRGQYLSSTAPAGTFSWVAPEVILGGMAPVILVSSHFCLVSYQITFHPPCSLALLCLQASPPVLCSGSNSRRGLFNGIIRRMVLQQTAAGIVRSLLAEAQAMCQRRRTSSPLAWCCGRSSRSSGPPGGGTCAQSGMPSALRCLPQGVPLCHSSLPDDGPAAQATACCVASANAGPAGSGRMQSSDSGRVWACDGDWCWAAECLRNAPRWSRT